MIPFLIIVGLLIVGAIIGSVLAYFWMRKYYQLNAVPHIWTVFAAGILTSICANIWLYFIMFESDYYIFLILPVTYLSGAISSFLATWFVTSEKIPITLGQVFRFGFVSWFIIEGIAIGWIIFCYLVILLVGVAIGSF